jgi:hypothetical protein
MRAHLGIDDVNDSASISSASGYRTSVPPCGGQSFADPLNHDLRQFPVRPSGSMATKTFGNVFALPQLPEGPPARERQEVRHEEYPLGPFLTAPIPF